MKARLKQNRSHSRIFSNQILLLFLLFLDLAGFTLIFPLIPSLLEYYINTAPSQGLDFWVPNLIKYADNILQPEHQSYQNRIVLIGGFLTALYSLAQFLTAPYWGRLSDFWGRRPVLLMTSVGLAFSYLLWFFSESFTLFCLSRLMGGIMGGNIGVASASMADMSPPEKRTNAMGMVGAAFGLGFLLGPILGGLSMGSMDSMDLNNIGFGLDGYFLHPFAMPALIALSLSLLSAILNAFFFQETLAPAKVEKGDKAFLPQKPLKRNHWINNPISCFRRLSDKQFRRIVLINFFYVFIFSSYEFTFSFFYSLEFHLSPKEIGYIFFYLGIVYILGHGGLVRVLSQKFTPQQLLYIGLACIPLPLGLFGFYVPSIWVSLLALIPISLASSLVLASLSSLSSLLSSSNQQGYSFGLLRSFGSLGRVLSPISAALLYWLTGAKITYLVFGILLLLLFLYVISFPFRRFKEE